MTETLMVQKVAFILASLSEGEWFSHLFSVLKKNQIQFGKKDKFKKKNFQYFICSKKSTAKKLSTSLKT